MLQFYLPYAAKPGRALLAFAIMLGVTAIGVSGCALNLRSFGSSGVEEVTPSSANRSAVGNPPSVAPARRAESRPAKPWIWSHTKRGSQEIIVQPGESLYGLASRHRVAISELMAANRLRHPAITPGQRLIVPAPRRGIRAKARSPAPRSRIVSRKPRARFRSPPPRPRPPLASAPVSRPSYSFERSTSYVVRPGDTLYSIARKNGIDARRIASANGINNPALLAVGTILKMPR